MGVLQGTECTVGAVRMWRDGDTNLRADIRVFSNPLANLNMLFFNGDRKTTKQKEATLGWRDLMAMGSAGAADGFMDNGFIVQANC